MPVKCLIKPSEYHDSVRLMRVAKELSSLPGVEDAAIVMATEANKAILREAGLLTGDAAEAGPDDLLIAVAAEADIAGRALVTADRLLLSRSEGGASVDTSQSGFTRRPRTLHAAVGNCPDTNLAVISVAGLYAAAEAWEALHHGLHVLLFSDNVSLEEEVALKQYARQAGLLLMGPGAGTAFLNGAALGFANAVPYGPVGIVSAAGTGLQEVATLLAKLGTGITQGIGVGGRDLKTEAGGMMTLAALEALQADPETAVLLLVGKPPAPAVASKVLEAVAAGRKPTVLCFLGTGLQWPARNDGIIPVFTLQEAALQAARLAGANLPPIGEYLAEENRRLKAQANELRQRTKPGQRFLRGLYSGGTLCYEAQVIWRNCLPGLVWSNAPLKETDRLLDSAHSLEHSAIDLGEEEFTVGRPHPMIDNDLRIRRLLQEARDPETAVILLDIVLGYGAHPDPASEIGPAIARGRELARENGREILFLASVTGTVGDPQGFDRQVRALEEAGAVVCPSNAAAARLAAWIISA